MRKVGGDIERLGSIWVGLECGDGVGDYWEGYEMLYCMLAAELLT